MKIGRVIGNIVATIKHKDYKNHKIMLIKPEDPNGNICGDTFIALDCLSAGKGDRVLILSEGNGISQILGQNIGSVGSVIVGIIDHIDQEKH